ncbi:MAG: hypothetical protein H0V20_11115 [Actinobacteria bacterium]|nr:hypothetical protein [Actinomycetota bacterium]
MATTVTASQTVTETVASEAGLETSEPTDKGRDEVRFRGNGDRSLPPMRVMRGGAILRWTNSGEVFSLFGRDGILIDSVANQGETFLPAGVHRIDVVANGSWVITLPRSRRLR